MEVTDTQISKEMFELVSKEDKNLNEIVRPSETYWQDAWRRLKKNKLAMISLVYIILVTLAAILVPIIVKKVCGYDYQTNNFDIGNMNPNATHWFGTDKFGRDLFVRIFNGARISLEIAYVAAVLNLVIGVLYGSISAFIGGNVDNVMMRIVDMIYSIPMTIYVILFMCILGAGMKSIIIALTVSYWIDMARIVRGEILQLKQQEFVLAARTLGASNMRILLRHLIPNSMGPIIVTMTMLIPSAIFTEAFLSFIGLGIPQPLASWGSLASEAQGALFTYPYQLFFPSAAICLTILAFNLFGDGIRDALDPKMRK